MTEKEKSYLTENASFYCAEEKKKKVRKSSRKGALLCVCAGICILRQAYPKLPATDWGRAAAALSRAAAEVELMSLRFGEIRLNETDVNDNNNSTGKAADMIAGDDLIMLSKGSRRMPSSDDEESIVEDFLPPVSEDDLTSEGDSPLPYPENADNKSGSITRMTYTEGKGENYIDLPSGGQIRNATTLSSDEILKSALLPPDYKITLNAPADEPQVLIMHTHTTESYEPCERDFYDDSFTSRTTDMSANMAAVGDVMTEIFEKNGIRTLHDTTIHDYPSYNGSYDRSRITVTDILEKYPSIKVVLDVHRDAIERESGERIAPCADINGKSSAQVMIICGCDDGTMNMPDCMKNLRTASLFQQYMEKSYPGLTRPVLFDYRKYNQDLTTGSLLLEMGGHANSLGEALYAGELTAEAISDALISISE